MGGEVSVESELGKGSRFTIRMPLVGGRRKTDCYAAATLVPDVTDTALPAPAGIANA